MNILITVQTYYPKKDGVQMVTQYLAEGLANSGNKVTVITSTHKTLSNYELHNRVEIKRVNLNTKYALYFGDKKQYKKLIIDEANNNDVLINVCTQNAFTDLILKDLKKIKCKKILYLHGMFDFKIHKYDFSSIFNICNKIWKTIRLGYYYKINKKNFKEYDKVINLHQLCDGYDYFIEKYNQKAEIIENAADDRFFETSEEKHTENYFICVANYLQDKNQELCLEAYYKSVSSKNHDMIFIGNRNSKYYYRLLDINKKFEEKYGKRNVKFLTNIDRDKTIEYIKKAKLYLFGSKHEIFPVAIVEAMASGIPYLSTDVGCVRALPGGLICKNSDEMAYLIDLIISDENLKSNLKIIGREYAKKHLRIPEKVNQLNEILNSLLYNK